MTHGSNNPTDLSLVAHSLLANLSLKRKVGSVDDLPGEVDAPPTKMFKGAEDVHKDHPTPSKAAENAKLLSTGTSIALAIALAKLYDMAWGKPWPHISYRSISEAEIADRGSEHDDADGPLSDILHVPTSFDYECFDKMEVLRDVFGTASVMDCGLVVREEYGILLKFLEGQLTWRPVVVTGQPGIGSYDT